MGEEALTFNDWDSISVCHNYSMKAFDTEGEERNTLSHMVPLSHDGTFFHFQPKH